MYIRKTTKGIYLKVFEGGGAIKNVTFENIVIDSPEQFAIWIGPAQDEGGMVAVEGGDEGGMVDDPDGIRNVDDVTSPLTPTYDVCQANPCSLCWPVKKFAECFPIENGVFEDITLKNVVITNPPYSSSLGVIMGSSASPITQLTFHNVTVDKCGKNGLGGVHDTTNFQQTFPLLKQDNPIRDPAVIKLLIMSIALVFIFVFVPILTVLNRTVMKRIWWQTRTHLKMALSLLLLGMLGAAWTPIFLWFSTAGQPTYEDMDRR